MGYTEKSESVRVDFFKESGKWHGTREMIWDRFQSQCSKNDYESIHDIFERCLSQSYPIQYSGMYAVCLYPYHENAHPLMIKIPD